MGLPAAAAHLVAAEEATNVRLEEAQHEDASAHRDAHLVHLRPLHRNRVEASAGEGVNRAVKSSRHNNVIRHVGAVKREEVAAGLQVDDLHLIIGALALVLVDREHAVLILPREQHIVAGEAKVVAERR